LAGYSPRGESNASPGGEIEVATTFEPMIRPGVSQGELSYDFRLKFEDGEEVIPVNVKLKSIDWREDEKEEVEVKVVDGETGKPVSDAEVILSLPSGFEEWKEKTGFSGALTFRLPSSSSLEALYEQYNVSDYYRSYLLEVYGEGYKAYYSSEVETGVPLEVKLEPQHECFKYEKIAEEQTEFSVWWIKASKDFEYFATSAGAHSGPEMHPPSEVAVYFFNKDGKFLWRFPIPVLNYDNTDLCWGLDVSPDGSYVAVGCYDGSVYLINREGELVKKHQVPGMVRWVKFSPDGKYLAFGPTDNGVDYFGLFEVPSLKLVWEGFVGDWARTIDFSDDGSMIAVGSSNGVLSFFSIKGEKLWQASNGGLVPFLIGFDGKAERIATGGKGRTLIVYSPSGKTLWSRTVDHVIIAGKMAEDGSVAIGTVGGYVYYFDGDGKLVFRRTHGCFGHNGVYLTRNSEYLLIGGHNPVLLSREGTILWQLKSDMQDEAGFSAEQVECVNTVLLSEDASIMVLGYDSGKIEIWKGQKAEVEKPKPKADIDGDGSVNSKDLEILKNCYGLTSKDKDFNSDADLNGDGEIDVIDLAILAFQFGM